MKPTIFILCGPTGSGKTSLSLKACKNIPFEIVGADSLQIFRHMNIGTAKPTSKELESISHHMIDVLNPGENATAAWYAKEAEKTIRKILERGNIPLIVGGSGFYIQALESPPIAPPMTNPPEISNREAHTRLKQLDPEGALKVHPNDSYRLQRAMALLDVGEIPSQIWKQTKSQNAAYNFHWFGLAHDRKALYDRVNHRVQDMYSSGLVEETKSILERFPKAENRLRRTIGYRECLDFSEGLCNKSEAIERTQTASRKYAKRQLTWFRKDDRIFWGNQEGVLSEIQKRVSEVSGL